MQKNIETIEAVYEAFGRREIARVLSLFDERIEWFAANHSPLADQSPYVGLARVRDGVFMRMGQRFSRFAIRLDELFTADAERVVMLGMYEGTFAGTSTPIDAQVAHVWTLTNGKVLKFQQYTDTFQLAEAHRPAA